MISLARIFEFAEVVFAPRRGQILVVPAWAFPEVLASLSDASHSVLLLTSVAKVRDYGSKCRSFVAIHSGLHGRPLNRSCL